MRTKREMPLAEALEEITSTVQRLKAEGSARVNGSEIKLDEPVTLEIEAESKKGKGELEFEIKWPPEKSKSGKSEKAKSGEKDGRRGGGKRRLLLGVLAGVGLGAVVLTVIRRRRQGEEEDEF